MISLIRSSGRLPLNALSLALGIWVFSGPTALAGGEECATTLPAPEGAPNLARVLFGHREVGGGTLGYGPPGVFPGFQGFGLGFHPGYGYGGAALGVGAEGGYPFYGGPGYPHPDPCLRRLKLQAEPFPYFGGPGYPTPDHPHFYGTIGPLTADKPVISIGDDRYDVGYGPNTGAIPYPESVMAPFTTRAGSGAWSDEASAPNPSAPAASTPPIAGDSTTMRIADRSLGIDAEPAVDAEGVRGMKVSRISPGSPAEKAGLHAGDLIHSINGYVTTQPGNLEWIIAHAANDNVLKMTVRTASDARVHVINATPLDRAGRSESLDHYRWVGAALMRREELAEVDKLVEHAQLPTLVPKGHP